MSNFRPDFNKQHILGKPPTDLNDLSTAIRWNELWIGAIDADEKININTNELPNEDGELTLDAISAIGNIRQTDGYLFIPEWLNRSNLINVAEEIKNIKDSLTNITTNNQLTGVIEGINLIDINNEQQYDSNTKKLTLYTDDINEVANDPGLPHLWWTQGRFDTSFSLKNSTALADSSNLLRISQLNNGSQQQLTDLNRIIPKLDENMQIPLSLLPDNIVNPPVQVSKVYSGTNQQRLQFNTTLLVEGDIWKVTDGSQLTYIWKPSTWLQLTQPTNFDYIKSINQNLPASGATFVRPNLPSLGNPVGNVVLETKNIPEPAGLNAVTDLMYFSRDRVFSSITSTDQYIKVQQDQLTKKTQLSFDTTLLQNSNITIQDVYNAITVDGVLLKKSFNSQTQKIDIKLDTGNFFSLFTGTGSVITPTLVSPNPNLTLAAAGQDAIKFDVNINSLKTQVINSMTANKPISNVVTDYDISKYIDPAPGSYIFCKVKSGSSIILADNAAHNANVGTMLVLKPDTINGSITVKQRVYGSGSTIISTNILQINGSDTAHVYRYQIVANQPRWDRVL